jgi:hypothetical protein
MNMSEFLQHSLTLEPPVQHYMHYTLSTLLPLLVLVVLVSDAAVLTVGWYKGAR